MPTFAPDRLSHRLDLLSRARVQVRQGSLPGPQKAAVRPPRVLQAEQSAEAVTTPTVVIGRNVLDALGIVITIVGFFLALLWI